LALHNRGRGLKAFGRLVNFTRNYEKDQIFKLLVQKPF
jgi:hypothetical protein